MHQTKRPVRTAARLALATGLAVTGTLFAPVGPAAHAAAPAATVLPLERAHDVAAVRDRVFVSGGSTSTSVVVTSATGAVTGTIGGLPGPTDLLVSNDQSTLYVALPNANQIVAFDTGSLVESARYSTGAGACPSSLALAGRRLYFGYGCDQWGGNIGVVDLSRQPAVVSTGLATEDFYDHPILATTAGAPSVLAAGQPGLSPAAVSIYAVGTGGALTFQRRTAHTAAGSNLRDVALSRDGSTVYLAQGAPYGIQAFDVADLNQQSRFFPTTAYPNAVEVSRDGTRIAAGSDATYDPDVFFLRLPDGIPDASVELGENLVAGALAWAPGGGRLYAVSQHWSAGAPTLHVLPAPAA
ncbi:YncE family protein [Plantactinospora sp. WMMB782]|uniref:YncE family protein n=1 Tax=Plantactinospora sp. WMMB782 TaxID=3404121 RepID=UPI003B9235F1